MSTHTTFNRAITAVAERIPDKVAFSTPDARWTFRQVEQAANRIANGLVALGLGEGDRVACLTRHMTECSLLVLAAQKIGAVCMPVNWRLAPGEVEYIVNHGEAKFLMVDEEFLPSVTGIGLPLVRLRVSTHAMAGEQNLADWSAPFADTAPAYEGRWDQAALQLYSSGTTGLPKGVELSHGNLLSLSVPNGKGFDYSSPDTVTLNVAPTFHIGGLGMSLIAMYAGGESVTRPDFIPAKVVAAFGEHRVTHSFLVPAMIHALLQVPGVEQQDFSSLQVIGYGASPISEKVLTDALRVFGCKFVQNYGLTETTGTIVNLMPEDHDPSGPRAFLLRAAGVACPGTSLRVVDTATGKDVEDGVVGEVWIRSPQNMLGYWRNEKATKEAYPEGREDGMGWFRSGDAGSLRNGYLFIEDRIKDMIISGGENIYPVEVENTLMKHPAVLDCAVIAVPDEKWGESVKACVILRPGQTADAQELINFCRERLAHYKCPRSVDFTDVLPRTPSGKLQKHVLRAPFWKGQTRNVS